MGADNDHNHDERDEPMIFGTISEAIYKLACAVNAQTEWFKNNAHAATNDDLRRSTDKIIAAIRASNPAQDAAIVAAIEKLKVAAETTKDALSSAPK